MEKQKHPIFSKEWLKEMDARATKCRQEQGSPEVTTGYRPGRRCDRRLEGRHARRTGPDHRRDRERVAEDVRKA